MCKRALLRYVGDLAPEYTERGLSARADRTTLAERRRELRVKAGRILHAWHAAGERYAQCQQHPATACL